MDLSSLPWDNQDEQDPEGMREDFFVRFSKMVEGKIYLDLRNHFDEHVDNDGIEAAWICLAQTLAMYAAHINYDAKRLYTAVTGDSMDQEVGREE